MSGDWWKEDMEPAKGEPPSRTTAPTPKSSVPTPAGTEDWWKVDMEDAKKAAPKSTERPIHEPTIGGLNKKPTGPMSWKDLGKMFVEYTAKGIMDTVATPFRWGYDGGKWLEQTRAKLSGDQAAYDKATKAPDFHDGLAGSMVRGVPLVRDLVPQSEGDIEFQRNYPKAETYGNVAGAMVPAVATMGVGAPVAGANTWGAAARYAATQSGINAGLNTADRVAHSNNTATMDELLRGGARDVAFSSAVPFASKALAPNAVLAGENAGQSINRMAKTQDDLAKIAGYSEKFKLDQLKDKVPWMMMAGEALNTLKGGAHGLGASLAAGTAYLPQIANMRAINPGLGGYANKGFEAASVGTNNILEQMSADQRKKLQSLIPAR